MKAKLFVVLATLSAVSTLSGCYLNGRLYPVQGPLASQTPPPIFSVRMSGAISTGTLTVTLANGEVCKGAWGMVNRNPTRGGQGAAQAPPNLLAAWDTVYGQGFYTAHVLGAKLHVQAVLTGNKGTIIHAELYRPDTPNGLNEIRGVGVDNNGNIYKFSF